MARYGEAVPSVEEAEHGSASLMAVAPAVLLVGSEPSTLYAELLRLHREHFLARTAGSGRSALAMLSQFRPDVLVLHSCLPDGSAVDVLHRLRALRDVPAVLTGVAGELDRVLALDAGFDDVVPPPASPVELAARVRAVLRRCARSASGDAGDEILRVGPVALDDSSHRVWVSGRQVSLTALERRLLGHFLRHPGRTLSRAELLVQVWGHAFAGDTTVTVNVRRLREKIEPNPAEPTLIRTVWGVGYRFDAG